MFKIDIFLNFDQVLCLFLERLGVKVFYSLPPEYRIQYVKNEFYLVVIHLLYYYLLFVYLNCHLLKEVN